MGAGVTKAHAFFLNPVGSVAYFQQRDGERERERESGLSLPTLAVAHAFKV